MVEKIAIILAVLLIVVLSLVLLVMYRAEKKRRRKKQKKREEAKKLSLEKHKDIYEKAIKEINTLIVDAPMSKDSVRYDCTNIPVFVVEAIIEHFEREHWDVYFCGLDITIYVRE